MIAKHHTNGESSDSINCSLYTPNLSRISYRAADITGGTSGRGSFHMQALEHENGGVHGVGASFDGAETGGRLVSESSSAPLPPLQSPGSAGECETGPV
jgi:hypothetical protein